MLRRADQGHDRAHDGAVDRGGAARRQRRPARRVCREPAGHARAHAARPARDGAEGAPLGRRDGGDREDVRGVRPDPATFEGAAELYALVASTDLGRISPEDWRERGEPFDEVVELSPAADACRFRARRQAGCFRAA